MPAVESVLRVLPSPQRHSQGSLWWRGRRYPCALGRGGVLPASRKREGDEASPAGLYPLLSLYYRPDRQDPPKSALPTREITRTLGWCDDSACAAYNSAVQLPHPGSAETLWRADALYDLLVVIGHNRGDKRSGVLGPATPQLGSAIFLHVARDDFSPTRGCVAVARKALLEILPGLDEKAMIRIYLP